MLILYNLFLVLYTAAIRLVALWNEKARLWVRGRKDWEKKLIVAMTQLRNDSIEKSSHSDIEKLIWMHCASLGEFEQGRPVLEALRVEYPGYKIVLTFFSPSGYEVRKDWEGVDVVMYLPMDGARNARRFLDIVKPQMALFVKYEFWYYYLRELDRRAIPAILVSGAFRHDQVFFKPWGGFFRRMLRHMSLLTVQDAGSLALLQGIGLGDKAVLTGDTRYDRVAQIATAAKALPLVEAFKGGGKLLVGGSTWPGDERILHSCLKRLPPDWKLVLAPHEIDKGHIGDILSLYGGDAVLYSEYKGDAVGKRVLVIDNIGMLSALYRYGDIAFIGGGYNKGGIHNVLEPAVFGLPVVMGPVYGKFTEAVVLVGAGYAFPVKDAEEAGVVLDKLYADSERLELSKAIAAFVQERRGATERIIHLVSRTFAPSKK